MNSLICIKTYSRLPLLKKLIKSINKTTTGEYNIVVHDDGSSDGTVEYLESNNIKYFESRNIGTIGSANYLLMYARSQDFDMGFMLDDDLYFTKEGWNELYYDACKQTGYGHLSHFSTDWEESDIKAKTDYLVSRCNVWDSQGALWTFTPEVLNDVGYFDHANFGRRGEGHRDFSLRACMAGHNKEETFWDAKSSDKYIELCTKEDYVKTPDYDEEVKLARNNLSQKRKIMRNRTESYINIWPSPINYMFDHVYCVSLLRRGDRRSKLRQLLNKWNIDVQMFDAIDGRRNTEVNSMYQDSLRNNLGVSKGEIGCHLSHKYIYKDAIEKGFDNILILEEDIIAHKDLNNILLNCFNVPDWDMLYLGASDWYWDDHKENWDGGEYYRGERINATHAYALTRGMLKKAYKLFNNPVNMPCDTKLHTIHKKNKCYILKPHAFIQDVTESELRENRSFKDQAKVFDWELDLYEI